MLLQEQLEPKAKSTGLFGCGVISQDEEENLPEGNTGTGVTLENAKATAKKLHAENRRAEAGEIDQLVAKIEDGLQNDSTAVRGSTISRATDKLIRQLETKLDVSGLARDEMLATARSNAKKLHSEGKDYEGAELDHLVAKIEGAVAKDSNQDWEFAVSRATEMLMTELETQIQQCDLRADEVADAAKAAEKKVAKIAEKEAAAAAKMMAEARIAPALAAAAQAAQEEATVRNTID